ncbi:MAG TPA: hypothetical protein VMN36_05765 [Verrucomicrobiales bacterium]|nr:hypothetical protein [Verrucomicrobiales bacterium]
MILVATPPEPVRILSDLHLGHPLSRIREVEDLWPLIAGASTVVFNGDSAEVRMGPQRERALELLGALQSLLERRGVASIFLTGNHDPRYSEHHALLLGKSRLLATHGDFLIPFISPWSRRLDRCRLEMEKLLGGADPARWDRDLEYRLELARDCCDLLEMAAPKEGLGRMAKLREMLHDVASPKRALTIAEVWLRNPGRAFQAMERMAPETRVMVVGHTHWPGVWRRAERVVINTGGFVGLPRAQMVEFADGLVRVHSVRGKSGRCELGRIRFERRIDD